MNLRRSIQCTALVAFFIAVNAHAQVFTAFLSGPNENPANASPGTGFATVTLDLATHTFRVQVNFTGLTGNTTASHIHAPVTVPGGNAGVATTTPTFAGFPLGVTSGNYDNTLDMTLGSTWNPAYVTANGGTVGGAETAFVSSLKSGTTYLNIHSSAFGGGEIRGFLTIPEPVTSLLTLGGLAFVIAARRMRRTSRSETV